MIFEVPYNPNHSVILGFLGHPHLDTPMSAQWVSLIYLTVQGHAGTTPGDGGDFLAAPTRVGALPAQGLRDSLSH